ncbi:MAG: hypothetical protein IPO87_13865 [Flavobacteriales bacterium]|nr:hypothetical protein [Flavobacteriales bacterium]
MILPTPSSSKDAARVEDVVGEFVALKRKGPRFLGLCPFHNEKTPSFNVSPQLGIYKCFGCGEAGDSITFLTKHEHLSYVEAIKWLGKRYNIDLPEEEQSAEQELEQSERESLAVVPTWAQQWSTDQLWNTEEGRNIALRYFRERGFTDATIKNSNWAMCRNVATNSQRPWYMVQSGTLGQGRVGSNAAMTARHGILRRAGHISHTWA